jgi:hypothetical protein
MDCFCGCGRDVPRKLVDFEICLGTMAWELLAWSKALSEADPNSPDTVAIEQLVDRGAACYQRLLSTLHGESDRDGLEESNEWLEESGSMWRTRPEMTERGGLLRGLKLRVTDADVARLDRVRPERSFQRPSPSDLDRVPAAASDDIGQLERLGALRERGLLTEEEFRAAKARLLS